MANKGKSNKRTQRKSPGRRRPKTTMPFSSKNYLLIVIGLVIVAIGYIIMAVDGQIDGFLSLYVSPILLLAGYLEIIYAIVYREKEPAA